MRWTNKLPSLKTWKGDGIVAYVGEDPPHRPALEFVRMAGVPLVDLGTYADHFGAPKVFGLDQERGRLAAEHLLSLGLKHFGFVTTHDNPYQKERQAGFKKAIEAASGYLRSIPMNGLARQLSQLTRPMGLLALNDLAALQVIEICQNSGYLVPEEFAVIGMDDMEILCDLAPVPLSSVNCNHERIGYEAAALLGRLMKGKPTPRKPLIIPAKGVTVRASTDTIAIPDLSTTQALSFLRRNYTKPIQIRDAVPQAAISLRSMQKIFRKHVGRTLIQELSRLRVEHAKRLLAQSGQKIKTIAHESGFGSHLYFIRVFKKATGLTPKAFRQQHKSKASD